jgi:GNAT superfamily N-acetyltransferase
VIKADKTHKAKVIEILSECFEANKSVNLIVKQDARKQERIGHLMDYAFEACIEAGQIYLNNDLTAAIICSHSEDKLPILEEAYLTAKLVWRVTGIGGIGRAMRRERYVNHFHPKGEEFIYIWFIGVKASERGRGAGSELLKQIINESTLQKIPIYLETSTEQNLSFYQKHGFNIYHISPQEVFGFELYFLKRLYQ